LEVRRERGVFCVAVFGFFGCGDVQHGWDDVGHACAARVEFRELRQEWRTLFVADARAGAGVAGE